MDKIRKGYEAAYSLTWFPLVLCFSRVQILGSHTPHILCDSLEETNNILHFTLCTMDLLCSLDGKPSRHGKAGQLHISDTQKRAG